MLQQLNIKKMKLQEILENNLTSLECVENFIFEKITNY